MIFLISLKIFARLFKKFFKKFSFFFMEKNQGKTDFAWIYGSYFRIYMSGRTEKTSGALFGKECARGRKTLSCQMHPCINVFKTHLIIIIIHHLEGYNAWNESKRNAGDTKSQRTLSALDSPSVRLDRYIVMQEI